MKNRTYRYFTGKFVVWLRTRPEYTKFEYSGMKLSNSSLQRGDPLDVEVDLKNVGKRDGDEVAELYITFPKLPGAPLRALRGVPALEVEGWRTEARKLDAEFARPELRERSRRSLRFSWRLFGYTQDTWRAAENWRTACGNSSHDTRRAEVAGVR